MGFLDWLYHNLHSVLSDFGIFGALIFTALEMRSEAKTRRVANLLTVTGNHRQIWSEFFDHPELARVLESRVNFDKRPITPGEEVFVTTVILHLESVFYALSDDLLIKEEGLRRDVWNFISKPIPSTVWDKLKVLHNEDFVLFVESCKNWK